MATAASSTDAATIGAAYFAAVADRDPEAMGSFWEPGATDELHGVASLRAPEEVVDLIAGGEKVAIRWRVSGTFDGDARFEGAIATGARVEMTGCDVLTIRDGKIVHNDAYMNGMEMGRQLGLFPPRGSLGERAMIGAVNLRTRAARLLRR